MPARSLHELLAGLAGEASDPVEVLREGGHAELPEDLVAEAIVSYADSAPVEVAEHLAPFVTGHSAVPVGDPVATPDLGDGLQLLATAPVVGDDPGAGLDLLPGADAPADEPVDGPADAGAGGFGEIAFGAGGEAAAGGEPAEEAGGDPGGMADRAEPADPAASPDPFELDPVPAADPADLFPEPTAVDPDRSEDGEPGEGFTG